ncbi:hypothetical protein MRB53_019696 [Persea americana]|uniref:Uncharacterized protein n=1 Tax=Persea americana TaxID=3435 RepID=A0ACC2KYU2_PERAE|nr:hypothetical protein MRB53_019696 [Persea americana]
MDFFFQQELQAEMLWPGTPEIYIPKDPPRLTAFAPYSRPSDGFSMQNSISPSSHYGNLNKRMIEILGAIRTAAIVEKEPLSGYRHMIKERQRRDKMRQNYEGLLSLLPPRTKADKNTIVQTAASQVIELQCLKAELQSRNVELEARLAKKAENAEGAKINLKVVHPTSAMDSLVEVLKCLRNMEVKAKSIRSVISGEEFSAMVEIESKLQKSEVENAVKCTLMEVERKLSLCFAEATDNESMAIWDLWEGQ